MGSAVATLRLSWLMDSQLEVVDMLCMMTHLVRGAMFWNRNSASRNLLVADLS